MSHETIVSNSSAPSRPNKRTLVPGASFANVLEELARKDTENTTSTTPHTRPKLPEIQGKPSITFQNIDISDSKYGKNPSEILLFGVTKAGHSILTRVTGFEHYFFYPSPIELDEADMDPLRDYLNERLKPPTESPGPTNVPISKIEIEESKTAADGNRLPFLKIYLSDHHQLSSTRVFLGSGDCQYRDLFSSPELTCEARIPYFLRFMVDTAIGPMQWLKLPVDKYQEIATEERISHCQLEVSIHVDDLIICHVVENKEKFAPLRTLSYDIETDVPGNNKFPDASTESVLQIGAMLRNYGESVPFLRKIFTLGSCDPITGAQVESFEREEDMLMAWQTFLIEADPDIITGYNLTQFDIPYLLNRARTLNLDDFPYHGRLKGSPQVVSPGPPNHKTCPGYEGRLLLDIFQHIRDRWPGAQGQGKYTLNSVSERFLHEKKEDIPYTAIPVLQRGDSDSRRKLAVYCLKDVYLPLLLMSNLECFENEVKAARLACLPFNAMRNNRSLSVTAKQCQDAIAKQYILPDLPANTKHSANQAILSTQ